MLLGEILKQKRAGVSVSQLLSGEKQAVKARNLSRDVLEELRVKLWLVVPEQYEVTCECCGKAFPPLVRDGSLVTCGHCYKKTVVDDGPPGTQWIRFNVCDHVENVEKGREVGNCEKCEAGHIGLGGKTYTVCSIGVPKKADAETPVRERTIREIREVPWSIFPDKFVVTCVWGECHTKFTPFFYENYCFKCPKCKRLIPTVDVEHLKWVYYNGCGHLKHLPRAETIPNSCPECEKELGHSDSSLAKPVWNMASPSSKV